MVWSDGFKIYIPIIVSFANKAIFNEVLCTVDDQE